jgi:micrococcal nuclease
MVRYYTFIFSVFSLFSIVIAACSDTGSHISKDEFAAEVIKNYPALIHKKFEITTVKRVVDGDTFETVSDQKVRLIGVNTPEVYGGAQYYGLEASGFARNSLKDERFTCLRT